MGGMNRNSQVESMDLRPVIGFVNHLREVFPWVTIVCKYNKNSMVDWEHILKLDNVINCKLSKPPSLDK